MHDDVRFYTFRRSQRQDRTGTEIETAWFDVHYHRRGSRRTYHPNPGKRSAYQWIALQVRRMTKIYFSFLLYERDVL